MRFLDTERETLAAFLPNFDRQLADIPLLTMEKPDNPAIQLFRKAGGPLLLIPQACNGLGASLLDIIRIQRAIASRSPSLAIASTMHHFSVATMVELSQAGNGLESLLLEGIAEQNLLVASGFAEGKTNHGILRPTMQAKRTEEGYIVSGSKKPCSLTWSMDLLTASVSIPDDKSDHGQFAVVLIPANSEGLERKKFWAGNILAGAESDEIVLTNVVVPQRLVYFLGQDGRLDDIQTKGFLWFELLITASYLGIVSALAECVFNSANGTSADKTQLGICLEGSMSALEGVAYAVMMGAKDVEMLARMLFVRYLIQQAIEQASALAVEILGGMAFICSPEISYLYAATRALAFHPPSRTSMRHDLADSLTGKPISIK